MRNHHSDLVAGKLPAVILALLIVIAGCGLNGCGNQDHGAASDAGQTVAEETDAAVKSDQKASEEQDGKAEDKVEKTKEKEGSPKKAQKKEKAGESGGEQPEDSKAAAVDGQNNAASEPASGAAVSPERKNGTKKAAAGSGKKKKSAGKKTGKPKNSSAGKDSGKQKKWVDPVYKTVRHEEEGHYVTETKWYCLCGAYVGSKEGWRQHRADFIASNGGVCNGQHVRPDPREEKTWVVDKPAWTEKVLVKEGHWE